MDEENIRALEAAMAEAAVLAVPQIYELPRPRAAVCLKYSENIIFRLDFADAQPQILRVHRPGYHRPEEIASELQWMEELSRDTDIALPRVLRGRDGAALQSLSLPDGHNYFCSVISFLNGDMLDVATGTELCTAVEELGEITAKLHIQSMTRSGENRLERFSWDIHNFFDEDGIWGSWRNYPGLDNVDRQVLLTCQGMITAALEKFGRTPEHYGLIHADLHFCNVLREKGKNQIFDFDDCGYGFYLYDLGCTLVTCSSNLKHLIRCWLRGYERVRLLNTEEKSLLPMFVLLRRIVRLGWLASHWDSDTRKSVDPDYLPVTVNMARRWCLTGDI